MSSFYANHRYMQQANRSLAVRVTVAVVAVAVVSAVASKWFRRRQSRKKHVPDGEGEAAVAGGATTSTANSSSTSKDDGTILRIIQETSPNGTEFVECVDRIRSDSFQKSDTSQGEKLILYSLYKQATVGDTPARALQQRRNPVPGFSMIREHAKRSAWLALRGMSREEAIARYVSAVRQIERRIASGVAPDGGEDFGAADEGVGGALAPQMSRPTQILGDYEGDDEDNDSNEHETNKPDGTETEKEQNQRITDEVLTTTQPSQRPPDSVVTTTTNGTNEKDATAGPPGRDGRTRMLFKAAGENDVDALTRLLDAHYDAGDGKALQETIEYRDRNGQTILHIAADKGSYECLDVLITKYDADVNLVDRDDGVSVLQAAVIAGHVKICELLLAAGADPDLPDRDGDTPRSCAGDDGSEQLQALFVPVKEMLLI